jgi:quinoprotein glucose dehydrogenase
VPTNGKDEERTEFAGKSEEAWRGRDRVTPTTGTTVAAWKQGSAATGRLPLIDGLPVYKPLFQALAAYDMNTGDKLWDIPVGQTPDRIKNHPLLKGVTVPETGGTGNSIQMVVGDLLVQTTEDLRGETEVNEKGMPLLHARDKRTGKILASVELPIPGNYGMMSFMHEGKQYIVVQTGSARRNQPGALVALALP